MKRIQKKRQDYRYEIQAAPAPAARYWKAFRVLLPVLGFFVCQGGHKLLLNLDLSESPVFQKRVVENPLRDAEWETMVASLEKMSDSYNGQVEDQEASEFMLDVLKHNNRSHSRLRKSLPLGWELGHKTGMLRRSCHDVGVVFSPRGDYTSAKNFIARVARQTYQYYKIDPDYASAGAVLRPRGSVKT